MHDRLEKIALHRSQTHAFACLTDYLSALLSATPYRPTVSVGWAALSAEKLMTKQK
jgi:hypothetical protein